MRRLLRERNWVTSVSIFLPFQSIVFGAGRGVISTRELALPSRPSCTTCVSWRAGNSGLVTAVGFENDGWTRSMRSLSGRHRPFPSKSHLEADDFEPVPLHAATRSGAMTMTPRRRRFAPSRRPAIAATLLSQWSRCHRDESPTAPRRVRPQSAIRPISRPWNKAYGSCPNSGLREEGARWGTEVGQCSHGGLQQADGGSSNRWAAARARDGARRPPAFRPNGGSACITGGDGWLQLYSSPRPYHFRPAPRRRTRKRRPLSPPR